MKQQSDGHQLSRREKDVLKHLLLGKSARVIGELLGISQRTVESYIDNIKRKFQCKTKSEVIEIAMKDLLKNSDFKFNFSDDV